MLTVDEAVSTLQSSLQTVYGLLIGLMAVLSDLKNGKQVITSPTPISSCPSSKAASSTATQLESNGDDCGGDADLSDSYMNTDVEKGRVVVLIRNVLACWHFVVNLLYLIRRAVAVKAHIADPDKIVINPKRVKNLTTKFHNWFLK